MLEDFSTTLKLLREKKFILMDKAKKADNPEESNILINSILDIDKKIKEYNEIIQNEKFKIRDKDILNYIEKGNNKYLNKNSIYIIHFNLKY